MAGLTGTPMHAPNLVHGNGENEMTASENVVAESKLGFGSTGKENSSEMLPGKCAHDFNNYLFDAAFLAKTEKYYAY